MGEQFVKYNLGQHILSLNGDNSKNEWPCYLPCLKRLIMDFDNSKRWLYDKKKKREFFMSFLTLPNYTSVLGIWGADNKASANAIFSSFDK